MFLRSPSIGQHFAFAHGRTGVLQQLLISGGDIDRLLGTHDWAETRRGVLELPLIRHTGNNAADVDTALHGAREWIRRETAAMTPETLHDIFAILWTEDDEPMLSYLLKERAGFTSSISKVPDASTCSVPPSTLHAAVADADPLLLPASQRAFLAPLLRMNPTHPREIDHAVAVAYTALRLHLAKRSRSSLIRTFVRHRIDIVNIRLLLRTPEEERPTAALLLGGTVSPQLLHSKDHTLASAIRISHLSYNLADRLEHQPLDVAALERSFVDILAEDIARMWNVPLGIEPVFAFAALGLLQLSLVRALLIGKRNALAPQDVKRLLPPFIPAAHFVSKNA